MSAALRGGFSCPSLATLAKKVAYIVPEEVDLQNPNYPTAYIGDIAGSAMMPNSDWHHVLHMPHRYSGAGYSALITLSFGLQPRLSIRGAYSGEWGDWIQLATAAPPTVYDLPLAAGWGYQQKTCYFKTQDNVVTVNVAINATAVHHSGEIIATLPEGYRPMQSYEASATLKNPASAAALYIDTNGSLQNYGADISQGQMMYANISFVAA